MIEDNTDFVIVNESFPHIGKKILLFWGYPEFVELMDDLQQNKRGKPRQGFPSDVAVALDRLDTEHTLVFPELSRKTDMWDL